MTSGEAVQIGILGPIQVIADDGGVPPLSPQLRRVLGLLVVANGSPVSTDRLAEYVAGGQVEGSAVRTAVSRLRKIVGGRIEHRNGGYCVSLTDIELDAATFEDMCRQARSAEPFERIAKLSAALELWRGEPMGEFADEEWAAPSATRLASARSSATEDLAEAHIKCGQPDIAIELLAEHVLLHPFRERPVALLMLAHSDAGRTTDALRAFRRFRETLADETGLDPSSELRGLEARLLGAATDSSGSTTAQDGTTGGTDDGNLPKPLTSFVARSTELDELAALLDNHRLVTLIGVGGIGKTRLAVELANSSLAHFRSGRWIVELASASDPAQVPLVAAETLRIDQLGGDVTDLIVDRIGERESLLIVDSCEHVLDAAAELIDRLLAGCPRVRVVATSREPLSVDGERLLPIARLDPDGAERLFLERIEAAAPSLQLDWSQHSSIVELCERLDGIPLAIELAASRARTFTPIELVAMLDERFRLLVGRSRSGLDRHRTMRATLDWSYDLCSPVEQAVFDRVAVFPSGFDLDRARAIAADADVLDLEVVDAIPALVDRSMVERRTAGDGTTRYHLLETMRAYGVEHLQARGELAAVRDRHAAYIAELVPRLSDSLLFLGEEAGLNRLQEYWMDQRLAFDWAVSSQQWHLAMTLIPTNVFYEPSGRQEMVHRLSDAMSTAGATGSLFDEVCFWDDRRFADADGEEFQAAAWRRLRSTDALPVYPLGRTVASGIRVRNEKHVVELLEVLRRFEDAPPRERVPATWSIFRAVLSAGYSVDREEFERFEGYVVSLDSETAMRLLSDVRAHRARHDGDWVEALRHFEAAIAGLRRPGPGENGWFTIVTSWSVIEARLRAKQEVRVADAHAVWELARSVGHSAQLHRGACVTAMVLSVVGEQELADRFVGWVRDHDSGPIFEFFRPDLEDFSLDDPEPHTPPEDLNDLIDELRSVETGNPAPLAPTKCR